VHSFQLIHMLATMLISLPIPLQKNDHTESWTQASAACMHASVILIHRTTFHTEVELSTLFNLVFLMIYRTFKITWY